MKALVYRGPGKKQLEEMPKPALREATDAVVRMTKTTICGTDLHILKGDLPTVAAGRILGHEGIGVIEEVGTGVSRFHKGDRVLHLVHHGVREVRVLPARDAIALRAGRLDSGQHD
jgi:alcohol dehydrogenase